MAKDIIKLIKGYHDFQKKYAHGDYSHMEKLAVAGQAPTFMIIACSDSRVDPALLLQADPGDLFVVRNVANIVPPYEKDSKHHGTSAALEFGICYLQVKHLIILGHSQCGGIAALTGEQPLQQDDFISNWVQTLQLQTTHTNSNHTAKAALLCSYKNCLSFPWLRERVIQQKLHLHLWFFNIKDADIECYNYTKHQFEPLQSPQQII